MAWHVSPAAAQAKTGGIANGVSSEKKKKPASAALARLVTRGISANFGNRHRHVALRQASATHGIKWRRKRQRIS